MSLHQLHQCQTFLTLPNCCRYSNMRTQQTNISAWSGRAIKNHHQTSLKATAQMPSPNVTLAPALPAPLHPQASYAIVTPMCKGAARPRPCIDDSSISTFSCPALAASPTAASSGKAEAACFAVTPMCKRATVGASEESHPYSYAAKSSPSRLSHVIVTPMCKGAARPAASAYSATAVEKVPSAGEDYFAVTPMCKGAAVRGSEESCLNSTRSNVASITSFETQPPSPYSHSLAVSGELPLPEGQKPSSLNWRAPIFIPAAKRTAQSSQATAVVASDKEAIPISSLRSLL